MLSLGARRGTRVATPHDWSGGRAQGGLPTCVVVGLHRNGMSVARALGRHGVPVVAIDGPRADAYAATRFARRVACDDLHGPGLIECLCEVGRNLGERGVLILTLDRSVLLVSEHRERVEPYFVHSLPPADVVDRLMNKASTDELARRLGFGVPRTFPVASEDDLDAGLAHVKLPVILKPQVKSVAFVAHSPKKAFLLATVDEVRQAYEMVSQWERNVVLQEWIPGGDEKLVFGFFYFDERASPLVSFVGRKIRQWIPRCGTACSAEPFDDGQVVELGARFFREAGYRGFGAIEFKVGPSGDYNLIEPTVGRTEHIFALAVANGVNVPLVGYCHMAGLPLPAVRPTERPVVYVDLKRDWRAAAYYRAHGELSWPQLAAHFMRPRTCGLFAMDDPAPLIRSVGQRARARAARLARRVRGWASVPAHSLEAWRAESDVRRCLGTRDGDVPWRERVDAALDWLCAAQDATRSGGVSRAFSLATLARYPHGWQPAYPETTGYIIPTFFDCAWLLGRQDLAGRARRMADWEVSMMRADGGVGGLTVDRRAQPVVFNTGMVLAGLVRAWEETADRSYRDGLAQMARFLVEAQSRDGAWRRYSTASGAIHVHAYDALVAPALVRASRATGDASFLLAAIRNLEFTLGLQLPNGWFERNALRPSRNERPLTHTIGYAAAGLLDAGRLLGEPRLIEAARRTADSLLPHVRADGFLAGEFDREWQPCASWCCLTGNVQMAIVWELLFRESGDPRYRDAAVRATGFVARRQVVDAAAPGVRGGIPGADPLGAPYGRYQLLNWAAKYFVDALLLINADRREQGHPVTSLGPTPPGR